MGWAVGVGLHDLRSRAPCEGGRRCFDAREQQRCFDAREQQRCFAAGAQQRCVDARVNGRGARETGARRDRMGSVRDSPLECDEREHPPACCVGGTQARRGGVHGTGRTVASPSAKLRGRRVALAGIGAAAEGLATCVAVCQESVLVVRSSRPGGHRELHSPHQGTRCRTQSVQGDDILHGRGQPTPPSAPTASASTPGPTTTSPNTASEHEQEQGRPTGAFSTSSPSTSPR